MKKEPIMTTTKFVYEIAVVHTEDENVNYSEIFDSFPTCDRIAHYLDWVSVCDWEASMKLAASFSDHKEGCSPVIDHIQVTVYRRPIKNGN